MSPGPRTRRPIVMDRAPPREMPQGDQPIERAAMVSALVELRYPAYASELRTFIADFRVAHQSEPDVEQRVVDAIWKRLSFRFLCLSADPAPADFQDGVSEQWDALTPTKRDALRAYSDTAQEYEKELPKLADAEVARRYDEAASAAQREAAAQRH